MYNGGVFKVLWNTTSFPDENEEIAQSFLRCLPPYLKNSAGRPSLPGALPETSCLIAFSASEREGSTENVSITGRWVMDLIISLSTVDLRFRRFSKCCFH